MRVGLFQHISTYTPSSSNPPLAFLNVSTQFMSSSGLFFIWPRSPNHDVGTTKVQDRYISCYSSNYYAPLIIGTGMVSSYESLTRLNEAKRKMYFFSLTWCLCQNTIWQLRYTVWMILKGTMCLMKGNSRGWKCMHGGVSVRIDCLSCKSVTPTD